MLRIGHTAAYALTRRWRATGGAEGLPVIRVGRLLRVPVHELERLAAGSIDLARPIPVDVPTPTVAPTAPPPQPPRSVATPTDRRARRTAQRAQPTLFPEAS